MRARALSAGLAALAAIVLAGALAGEAGANVPITSLEVAPTTSQAGAHADVALQVTFDQDNEIAVCDCHVLREVFVRPPAGLVGAPTNIPTCTGAEFVSASCPVDSQIGVAGVYLDAQTQQGDARPVYNMEPAPGQLGLFAFPVPLAQSRAINVEVTARTESDYGLEFHTFGIPRIILAFGFTQVFWGVPADPIHDQARWATDDISKTGGSCNIEEALAEPPACHTNDPPAESNAPLVPFTQNPSECSGPLSNEAQTIGYDNESDFATDAFPAITGCDQLPFEPSQSVKPTTTEADSPSGMDLDLRVNQTLAPAVPVPSAIRDAIIRLPEGFTINPNAADGKSACTAAQAKFGTRLAAECPEHAKVGTLQVQSTSLPGPLRGAIYLGEPLPGNRYRIFLVFDGFSLHVKLPGTIAPDPSTGRLTISFRDLPQFNFQRFGAHVFGAERGSLATPEQCGTYAVESEFVPWASGVPNQTSVQFFEIDSGPNGTPCPPPTRPFGPSLNAGVTDNTGGAHTDFVFDLTRADGHQYIDGLTAHTPRGFSGVLAGIPYCPDATLAALGADGASGAAELANPACEASRIGTAHVTAGAGTRPVSLQGRVYLAGPYKGAPLSLAVVTPAVSGPYDLGNVVARAAINVDPVTADITTVSDPVPQIVEGIPVRVRRVLVILDREDFALNPTNCSRFSVSADVTGDQGTEANPTVPFQVANCASLDFGPRLGLRLRGSGRRNAHPGLQAVLRAGEGEANIRRAAVTLPRTTLLDQGNIRTICTRDQFATDSCPKGAVYGRATAFSPLLGNPLRGPVYLRSNGGARQLPDLLADLHGQVDFQVIGYVDSVRGGLRTIFPTIPDVPVEKFVLRMQGGKRKGLVVNSVDLCRNPSRARSVMRGQNGARSVTHPRLRPRCAKKRKKSKRRAGVSAARKAG